METKPQSSAEKMKRWREQKAERKKATDKRYYEKKRQQKIAKVRDSRGQKTHRPNTRAQNLKAVTKKRKREETSAEEERRQKIREQTRKRVQNLREKRRAELREAHEEHATNAAEYTCSTPPSSSAFQNRMAKARALKKTTQVLPKTPQKKAELVETISSSKAVQLKRRVFFYVPSSGEGAVERKRDGRKFKEVKGIRKWHCVKSLPQQEKVMVRHRSCYCTSCIFGEEDNCSNKEWLDEWKTINILRDGSVATTRQANEEPILDHDTAVHLAELAVKGSTVAIAADEDPMYDFYLLQVTSDGVEELASDFTDDYHCTALKGQKVLKGHFYLRENIHDMTFTLDVKRIAMVYAATVRHICGDLPVKRRARKPVYKLPLLENEEIIASL
ncbi:vicilin-like seed storage protein At2g18540 [Stylophora pistillata]|uniref:vicilin-like seed storage protein At2g18540 n=1 Tax=Stylophora pistillata TaxID=50429 RepID=UPI000C04B1FF|nr:vicilin-like seed storage protein At2g18540 [Stylophora pistillata]